MRAGTKERNRFVNKILKVLLALVALPLLLGGAKFMLSPASVQEALGVTAGGAAGMSTIRGAVAPALLGSSVLIIGGVWRNKTGWLSAVALLMLVMVLGRVLGLALDGFSEVGLRAAVIETLIAIAAGVASTRFRAT